MKIYIAGKTTGNPNYKSEFDEYAKFLEKKTGHIPLNPAVLPDGMEPEDYMRICFAMIDSADVIAFLPGYQKSEGARLELAYARYIHKPYYYAAGPGVLP